VIATTTGATVAEICRTFRNVSQLKCQNGWEGWEMGRAGAGRVGVISFGIGVEEVL
jgi:hypothetical protein